MAKEAPAIRRGDRWPPAGHGDLDPLGPCGSGRGRDRGGLRLCRLGLRGGGPDCVLPRPLCGRLSLECFFLRALRLASRLAKLLLRLSELGFEALQVVLEITDLTLDRVDPVVRGGGLRGGIDR
jgi:hypothetical protein